MNTDTTRKPIPWQYTVIIAAVGFLLLWDPINKWWNFQSVTVEVKSVRALCAAIGGMPLEVGECVMLRQKHQNDSAVEIKPRTFVSFDYVSPVDGKTHSTSTVRELDDSGQVVHPGSRITVRLSRRNPDLVVSW